MLKCLDRKEQALVRALGLPDGLLQTVATSPNLLYLSMLSKR
jgi:hypothetical protein